MPNLKEIRNRIGSVSSTMQITSAMKMVSAAKLKKAQESIIAMRPYSIKLTELIQGHGKINTTRLSELASQYDWGIIAAKYDSLILKAYKDKK